MDTDHFARSGLDRHCEDAVAAKALHAGIPKPLLDALTWDAMVVQVVTAIRPWLGEFDEDLPDRRLDAVGLEEPRGSTPRITRQTAH